MTVNSCNQLRQPGCVCFPVIHTGHQAVFKGNSASCLLKIIPARIHHLMNLILFSHRHQRQPLLLRRSVKGECQCNLQLFFCQPGHIRHNSAGGHRNIALADMHSFLIRQKPDKFQKILIVIQGLSRPHHHHMRHPLTCSPLNPVHLVQHFRRGEVTHQPVQRGGAESAPHAAACLRRNAHTVAVMVTHKDTLHHISVIQCKQVFLRPVHF